MFRNTHLQDEHLLLYSLSQPNHKEQLTHPTKTYFDLENMNKQEEMFCPVYFYSSLTLLKLLYHHPTGADD